VKARAVLGKTLENVLRLVIGTSTPSVMKRIAVLILLSLIYFCSVGVTGILYGTYQLIKTTDLSHGYSIKVWKESLGLLGDWDPDIPYASIYYQIEKQGDIAVPKTYLHLDFDYTFDFKVVFAESNALACLYDTKLWTEGLYIIWDQGSGESWPRLRDDEVSYEPSVQQKWADRYTRLKRENPILPAFGAISDP
jgi:hypothetical protein